MQRSYISGIFVRNAILRQCLCRSYIDLYYNALFHIHPIRICAEVKFVKRFADSGLRSVGSVLGFCPFARMVTDALSPPGSADAVIVGLIDSTGIRLRQRL